MNKCLDLKIRTHKGIKYQVCLKSGKKGQINENLCYMCPYKEYKKTKSIKKISKKRIFVEKETYNQVYTRDGGRCRLCGNYNNLHLHHIIYRSESKLLINEVSNCIMLCGNCHRLVHSNKKKYQQILKELVGDKNEII